MAYTVNGMVFLEEEDVHSGQVKFFREHEPETEEERLSRLSPEEQERYFELKLKQAQAFIASHYNPESKVRGSIVEAEVEVEGFKHPVGAGGTTFDSVFGKIGKMIHKGNHYAYQPAKATLSLQIQIEEELTEKERTILRHCLNRFERKTGKKINF